MPHEPPPESSPDQDFARKLAAQELAKYCEEFSRWRGTKRGRAAIDQSRAKLDTLRAMPIKKPDGPAPRTSV